MSVSIPLESFLIIAAILFCIGLAVVLSKKNTIAVLMGIELMLNAGNLNLIAFSRTDTAIQGQMFSLFVIVIAAAEIAVALAILIQVYFYHKSSYLDKFKNAGE